MQESKEEITQLQSLLDASYASAGEHLQSIHARERRLSAQALCEYLQGMKVFDLATVSANARPVVAPVDGLFFHGRLWFGSAPNSTRFRHIRRNAAVSAAHTFGEEVSIIIHGDAREVDLSEREQNEFVALCLQTYGESFKSWGLQNPYAYIDARRFYAMRMETS